MIGGREWFREAGGAWEYGPYGGGGPPYRTGSFIWSGHATTVRLLGPAPAGSRTADVASMDPGDPPFWFRLRIDVRARRVVEARMSAQGHFMTQRLLAFNRPVSVEPPAAAGG